MGYLKAIRDYCKDFCCNGSHHEVKFCPSGNCFLYPYRLGIKGISENTPLKSIKLRCKDCSPEDKVSECEFTDCQLYFYRMGKNPKLKGRGNPESLKKYKEKK